MPERNYSIIDTVDNQATPNLYKLDEINVLHKFNKFLGPEL